MTDMFIDRYTEMSRNIDTKTVKVAKKKLQEKKVVIISGPSKCGKTSLAVSLASSYTREDIVLLLRPDDVRSIDFHKTSLVIIDEFAKYFFEKNKLAEWYTKFDQLQEAVLAGKLNIILTCETTRLTNCRQISAHELLSNEIELSETLFCVKKEPGVASSPVRTFLTVRQYSVRTSLDETNCNLTGCCILRSREILLADGWNKKLKKLDDFFHVIEECDLSAMPLGVCFDGEKFAITFTDKLLHYVEVSDTIKIKDTVTLNYICHALACHGNTLYIASHDSVNMHTLGGKFMGMLYKHEDTSKHVAISFCAIAVSEDGCKVYITEPDIGLITINNRKLLSQLKLPGARCVCVDDKGNVLVGKWNTGEICQVSSDGARKLGTIAIENWLCTRSLIFERETSTLVLIGDNDDICLVRLSF